MERIYKYIAVSVYGIAFISGLLIGSLLLIGMSVAMLTLGIAVYKGWYLIEAEVFRHSNLIQVLDGYQISADRQAAMRVHKGRYVATAVAELDTSAINDLDKERLEDIIKSTNMPFKLVIWVQQLNLAKTIDDLKTKKYSKEAQLSRLMREKPNEQKLNAVKRAIAQIEADIIGISAGRIPLKLAYYIMVSAASESSFNAREDAITALKRITSSFDAILKSKSRLVTGNELVETLSFDALTVYL